jgi:hypothetical protein
VLLVAPLYWKRIKIDFDVDSINKFVGNIMIDILGRAYFISTKNVVTDNNIFIKISHNNFFIDATKIGGQYYLQDNQNNIYTPIASTLDTKLIKKECTLRRITKSVKSANNVHKIK